MSDTDMISDTEVLTVTEPCEDAIDPPTDAASPTDGQEDPPEQKSIEELEREVSELRERLREREELDRAQSRVARELDSFAELFPDTDLHEIPQSVWDEVRRGGSLCAGFALHIRLRELERERIAQKNERNRRMSSGSILGGESESYYSPDEVKRMTPRQVREKYDDIIESMKHWN